MKKGFISLLVFGSLSVSYAQYWAPYSFYFLQNSGQENNQKSERQAESEDGLLPLNDGFETVQLDYSDEVFYANPDDHFKK